MSLPSALEKIQNISHQASTCKESKLLVELLKLHPIISSSKLTLKQMQKVKQQIWLSDLLHILVEVLRQDFSTVEGTWDTAQRLAYILASVCAVLHPTPGSSVSNEQTIEFYDILLPTALDSTLILAMNFLEAISDDTQEVVKVTFNSIVESLLMICQSHSSLVLRTFQSPYLLHMLITDHVHLASKILNAVSAMLEVDPHCLLKLPQQTLNSILDELVYKISGTDEMNAYQSLNILAAVSAVDPTNIDLILSRYSGLQQIVRKWQFTNLEKRTFSFIEQLGLASTQDSIEEAAIVIQASWRGYSARKKMKRIHNGILRFQQYYKRWKERKEAVKRSEAEAKKLKTAKQETMKHNRLAFLESQLTAIEQLPSSEVSAFISQQKEKAAVKIQSCWRRHVAKIKYSHLRENAHLCTNATVIQRAYRRHIDKRRNEQACLINRSWALDKAQRESLQREINEYRCKDGIASRHSTESETRELHDRVQGMLEDFYVSRSAQNRLSNQQKLMFSQLERSDDLLSTAPSLSDSFTMNVAGTFCSSSSHIAGMGKLAHSEELKAMNLPWWKQNHIKDFHLQKYL